MRGAGRAQVDDLGRATFDGLKAKLSERDSQLDEALEIIRELNDALQGARSPRCRSHACARSTPQGEGAHNQSLNIERQSAEQQCRASAAATARLLAAR